MHNETSLDTICSALCYAMGVEPPKGSGGANEALKSYIDEKLGEKKADRVFVYNPDAIVHLYKVYGDI